MRYHSVQHRRARFLGVSALAVIAIMPGISHAQQASPVITEADEIIVTATRRAEGVSKVPISISAYSQANLDSRGVRDIRDIANQTPGVDISSGAAGSGGQTRITIRGIDSTAGAATSAVYIDDTPIQARNASLNYNGTTIPYIFDIERVEVLRGPQGTLFGASSQGGAIRFITPTPSLTDSSAYGRLAVNTVKNGGVGHEMGFAFGGPIIEDKLGFRFSAYRRVDSGWIDRQNWQDPSDRSEDVNGVKTIVLRGSVQWKPTEWLSLVPSIYYQDVEFKDRASLWTRCPTTFNAPAPTIGGVPQSIALTPCPEGVSDPENGKFISYGSVKEPSRDKFVLPALRVTADAGPVALTSVTSYFSRHVEDTNDATQNNDRVTFGNAYLFPVTPGRAQSLTWQNPNIYQRAFVQEVRLSSNEADAPIRWTVGAYYSRTSVRSDLPINEPHFNDLCAVRNSYPNPVICRQLVNGIARYYGNEKTVEKTLAGFANIDVKLFDRLTATVGGRYSRDTLDFDVVERGVSYVGGITGASGRLKESPFLPKVALSFQATNNALYYASFSQGYRTGGVNKALPDICNAEADQMGIGDANVFQSDKTNSFEIGTKNRLLGGLIQYELSAFHIKWKNIQQQLRLQCAFSLVANTASATSKGFDANINVRPMDGLSLGVAVGYVKATYDKTIQIGTAPIVMKGQTLGATPWMLNLNGEYQFPVGANEGYVRAQYNYRGVDKGLYLWEVPTATTYDPTRTDPAALQSLDLRAGYRFGNYDLMIYAENALNNVDFISDTPTYPRGPLWRGTTQRPRTIGLQLIARY